MNMIVSLLITIFASMAMVGCGGGDDQITLPPPSVDLSGVWSGSWLDVGGVQGPLTLNVTQNAASLSGTASFPTGACFTGGNVSGTVSANNIKNGLISAGNLRIEFEATLVSNNLNGDFTVVQGGVCTGNTGTWVVTR